MLANRSKQCKALPWIAVAAFGWVSAVHAVELSDLYGKSIETRIVEPMSRRRGPGQQYWHDRIYVSDRGRIFHKFEFSASDSDRDRIHEIGPDGATGSTLRWSSGALTRTWKNGRGRTLMQSIVFYGTPGNLSCQAMLARIGRSSRTTSSTCTIRDGNILAR